MKCTLAFLHLVALTFAARLDCSNTSASWLNAYLELGTDQQTAVSQALQNACSPVPPLLPLTPSSLACQLSYVIVHQDTPPSGVPTYLDRRSVLYTNRTRINWSDNCWQMPSCILAPTTTAQVSKLLKVIRLTETKFAVRSGGHNSNVGFASVNSPGILIDMVNLDQVILSANKQIASIGPGVRNGQAYSTLDKQGYYVNGGKDPSPAFGGLLLGGGITYLASQYGIAANSIKSIEMVLGNGSIVNANRSSNQDLLWAVKGGGPNYGIVTRYDLEAVPAPKVWYEYLIYGPYQAAALLTAVSKYQDASESDEYSSLVFQSLGQATIVGLIYGKPVARPAIFDMFYQIPYQSVMTNSTIGTIAQLVGATGGAESEAAQMYAGYSVALRPDLDVYNHTFVQFLDIAKRATKTFNGTVTYGLQPVTSRTARLSLRDGGTPLNLTLAKQTWFITTVQWSDPADTAAAYDAINSLGAIVEQAADDKGVRLPFRFMNDANYQQNVFIGYGAESIRRMRNVAEAYDPQQVFQLLQNDGWLLSKIMQ